MPTNNEGNFKQKCWMQKGNTKSRGDRVEKGLLREYMVGTCEGKKAQRNCREKLACLKPF